MTDAKKELERLKAALAASGDVAYYWNLETDAITWYEGTASAFGILSAKMISNGMSFKERINPEDLAYRETALTRAYENVDEYECEYRVRLGNGDQQWFHDRGTVDFSPAGHPVRVRGMLRKMNVHKRSNARLEYYANYDSLTGHYNRARLREALDHALYYSQRYGVEGAYMVIGIDKLTMVNQAFGHEIADAVIVAIGERLDRCMRTSDIIGRVGGDRFGAVLTSCPPSELANAAEKILDAARNTVVDTPAGPIHVTVSIGAVSFPAAVRTATDAMTKADIALQKAKQSGRDCLVCYSHSEDQLRNHRKHMVIAEQVQRALRENRMVFAYQPMVDATTLRPVHYECLLRLQHEDGEVMPAAQFMPVVEELGMIRPIDRRGLEMAVDLVSTYADAHVALNVSGLTTNDRSWLRTIVSLLRGRPEVANRITVEITETANLEDLEACGQFVATLRDLECRVALDDFGAGYTSFRHLKQLPVNMVKIDGSFVRNINQNPDNLVFVRTLLDLARNFSLETVAECVETEEETRILRDEGVQLLQGYAFGKPSLILPWDAAASRSAGGGAPVHPEKVGGFGFGAR